MLQSVTLLKRKLFLYKGLLLVSLPELNASWPRLTGYLGSQPPAVALSGGGRLDDVPDVPPVSRSPPTPTSWHSGQGTAISGRPDMLRPGLLS